MLEDLKIGSENLIIIECELIKLARKQEKTK